MNSKVEKLKADWLAATKAELAIEEMEDFFEYLDDLGDSGVTNMFGASPYLEEAFGIDRKWAMAVLSLWMTSCNEEPPADRARRVMTE